jgi:predicted amidohydrolase YtcJ
MNPADREVQSQESLYWSTKGDLIMKSATRVLMFSLLMATLTAAQERQSVPVAIIAYPDTILYNGKIVTMDDGGFNQNVGRTVQAIAIRDRKIQALGTNDLMLSYAGPNTVKIDVKGKTVIPGIVDPHTHIHNGTVSEWVSDNPAAFETMGKRFSVAGATSPDLKKGIELVLKERAATMPEDQWVFINLPTNDPKNPGSGTGYGVNFLQQKDMPLKDIDALDSKHPVFLAAHPAYTINTAAKDAIEKIYGYQPPIEMADEDGFGELTEYERSLIVDVYFRTRLNELTDIVEDGLRRNAAVGITTFASHMMGLQYLNVYQKLSQEDRQPVRYAYTNYFGFQNNPDPEGYYLRLGDHAGLGNDYFWSAGVGLGYIDSGPPMFCSTMEAPKEVKDREWCRNAPGTALSRTILSGILAKERVVAGHAYADKGVDYMMDAVEKAMEMDPQITLEYVRSRRFSSDHCGFYPRPDQLPRMARLGWYISCGGNVLSRSYPWLERYGLRYANWVAPIKSLINARIKTVYENEAGVDGLESEAYWTAGYDLITRKNSYGKMVAPEEATDRFTLMKMSTIWPAEYVLREKQIGTLETGKFADLLVLNKDYFTIPEDQIPDVYPLMTMVGGRIEVLREEFARELGRQAVGPQLTFERRNRYAAE